MNNETIPGHSVKEGGYSDKKALEGIGLSCVCRNMRGIEFELGLQ